VLDAAMRDPGPEHPNTLIAQFNMGTLYEKKGDDETALEYYQKTLADDRRVLGDDHPNTLFTLHAVASTLMRLGRLSEAEPLLREALATRRRSLGDDHLNTMTSVMSMGDFLTRTDRFAEAVKLLEDYEHTARTLRLDDTRRRLATYLAYLGRAQWNIGRFSDGEKTLRESYDLSCVAFGPKHAHTMNVITELAELNERWHEVEPGRGHDVEAQEWRGRLEGDGAD